MERNKIRKLVILMLVCMDCVTHARGWPWPWSPWWQPPPRLGWQQPPPPTPPPSSPPQTPPPSPPRHPQPPPPPKSSPPAVDPKPSPAPRQPAPTPRASEDPADCQAALIYVDGCIRDLITFFFEKDGSSLGQNCCGAISKLSDDCFSKAFAGFNDLEFTERVEDYCASQFHV